MNKLLALFAALGFITATYAGQPADAAHEQALTPDATHVDSAEQKTEHKKEGKKKKKAKKSHAGSSKKHHKKKHKAEEAKDSNAQTENHAAQAEKDAADVMMTEQK